MGKFKAGDRVRYTGKHKGYNVPKHIGQIGTVKSDYAPNSTAVTWDNEIDRPALVVYRENLELVPAWQPKVGDKVRWLGKFNAVMYTEGKVYEIHRSLHSALFVTDDRGNMEHTWDTESILKNLELVAPLTIEAGKFYKTRDGRKVGPMVDASWYAPEWKWTVEHPFTSSYGKAWRADGTFSTAKGQSDEADLVALWEEPAVTVAASNDNAPAAEQPAAEKPKFKVGDRVVTSAVTDAGVGIVREVYANRSYLVDFKDTWYRTCTEREKVLSLAAPSNPAIVALIENGQPKPATRPKVHADQASATMEAERLALQFPGQQFGIFVLADSKIADVVNVPTAVLRAA